MSRYLRGFKTVPNVFNPNRNLQEALAYIGRNCGKSPKKSSESAQFWADCKAGKVFVAKRIGMFSKRSVEHIYRSKVKRDASQKCDYDALSLHMWKFHKTKFKKAYKIIVQTLFSLKKKNRNDSSLDDLLRRLHASVQRPDITTSNSDTLITYQKAALLNTPEDSGLGARLYDGVIMNDCHFPLFDREEALL